MTAITLALSGRLICRIGSLEIGHLAVGRDLSLICRIGSLESERCNNEILSCVICRIGSLEMTIVLKAY